jgi:hypothetical protein
MPNHALFRNYPQDKAWELTNELGVSMLAYQPLLVGSQRKTTAVDNLEPICALLETNRHLLGTWDETWARLFAIDCASIIYRFHIPGMDDAARDLIHRLLHQARKLTVADRQEELGSVERALMAGLRASSDTTRPVWLVALNSLLPDPFRAALVTVESSVASFGPRSNARRDAAIDSMRSRLLSRTEEAALLGNHLAYA